MMTPYRLIGLHFEEQDLFRVLGRDYEEYQNRMPMLIPLARI